MSSFASATTVALANASAHATAVALANASAPATTNLQKNVLFPGYTHIPAKHRIVQPPIRRRIVQIRKLWIPDQMTLRIHILHRACPSLVRPHHIIILSQKVIVLLRIHYQRDLGRIHRATTLKRTHLNIRIIS